METVINKSIGISDKLFNTILTDNSLNQELIEEMIHKINLMREDLVRKKLKELVGIDLDIEEEQTRRFKRIFSEVKGNKETFYFNDGSPEGLKIITFIRKVSWANNNSIELVYDCY